MTVAPFMDNLQLARCFGNREFLTESPVRLIGVVHLTLHFDLRRGNPDVGAELSVEQDISALAARPLSATVCLVVPRKLFGTQVDANHP